MTEAPARTSFPWLWPYGEHAAWCFHDFSNPGSVSLRLNQLLNGRALQAPLFVHSKENFGALAYEHAVRDGSIPTRDLGHDWYNGHVWLTFTAAKKALNDRHIQDSLSVERVGGNGRSRLRDALTLFDESGALLLTTSPAACSALLQHDWKTLFPDRFESWGQQARVLVVGHGLLDALDAPHPGLCAKAIPVFVPTLDLPLSALQSIVSGVVAGLQDPANFSPLPMMGIPGWFEESKAPGYYDNKSVYRAKPTRNASSGRERLAFVWDGSTLRSGKCVGQSLPVHRGEESPDSSEHGAG